jgi:hypothetical protein
MHFHPLWKHAAALLAPFFIVSFAAAQTDAPATPADAAANPATEKRGKEVLIPQKINRVPADNDFDNPDSEYCYKHSRQSDNFVMFWAKEFGDDPSTNQEQNKRFDPDFAIRECERFYTYYTDTLKWVEKDKSYASKYKFLIFVIGGPGGTAFGGSIENKIGALWTPATRVNRTPYGVLAHELGHSFQAIVRADGASSFRGGAIHEMTSQYMLWQVYPEWMTFENYHLNDFMKATHLAFLHEDNMYHSAYVLEYWSNKHGVEFVGKMWRETKGDEDPVLTYKRLTNISQEQFNDEMFDACRRFVTWDMPRIDQVAARYANQHSTSLAADDGWYKIAPDKCPQNYGYNAIKLKVPEADTKVTVDFEGLVGADGYRSVQPEKAGWRYGLLASKADGSRVYSDMSSKAPGKGEFTVPADTKFLWLVVMGAPTEHWIHVGRGRGGGGAGPKTDTGEQWPYRVKLTGTAPDDSIVKQVASAATDVAK